MKKHIIIISIIATVALFNSSANAEVNFNDGGYHIIDFPGYYIVYVDYETPGVYTHLELTSGGSIIYDIYGWEDGRVTISGGNVGRSLNGYDRALLTVDDGLIGGPLIAMDESQIMVTGGSIDSFVRAHEEGQIIVSGGTITDFLGASENSHITISGGSVGSFLYAHGNSEVIVSGGTFADYFWAQNNGLIILEGTDFAINGMPVEYDDFAGDYTMFGTITGTLKNGDILNNTFQLYHEGDITFIPEPATIALLAFGVLALRKKRRV